jgi:hypothetical protein
VHRRHQDHALGDAAARDARRHALGDAHELALLAGLERQVFGGALHASLDGSPLKRLTA